MGKPFKSDRYGDTGYSMKDTSPEVNAMIYERMMALSGGERLKKGFSMLATAKEMIMASISKDLPAPEQKRILYKRLYGEEMPDELFLRIQSI